MAHELRSQFGRAIAIGLCSAAFLACNNQLVSTGNGDAGTEPANAGADAGPEDAGPKPVDAGRDAGPADAGYDAGSDAGFDAGTTAVPPGKIDHLIFIVNENHTFDNLFSGFPGADSVSTYTGVDGGLLKAPQCPDSLPHDLCHAHSCALTDWNDGGMNGWVYNDTGDDMSWCQYSQSQIPGYWALAKSYALADQFHASMMGPSFPGHMFTVAAQAAWATDNPSWIITLPLWGCDDPPGSTVPILENGTCTGATPSPCFGIPSAPTTLPAGATWKFYGTGISFDGVNIVWSMFDAVSPIRYGSTWGNVVPYSEFSSDVDAGNLPTVSWLVNQDIYSGHPPLSMCANDTWVVGYVDEIINSPYYMNTAIVITWDDFGGFYDHVPPPQLYGCDATQPYGMGFRLPALIISPWVKNGVFHGVSEQASMVRLVEEVFGGPGAVGMLNALDPAARDAAAGSLLPAFDFNQQPIPPTPAPTACNPDGGLGL